MITRIQVRNYKSLRYIDVPLKGFHVLVGPNASGKSAFLDVLSFLHDFISEDLEYAVKKRTDNFFDLVWGRGEKEKGFEIAVEAEIPNKLKEVDDSENIARYEVLIQFNGVRNEFVVAEEKFFMHQNKSYLKVSTDIHQSLISEVQFIGKPYLIKLTSNCDQAPPELFEYDMNNNSEQKPQHGGFDYSGRGFAGGGKYSILSVFPENQFAPSLLWFKSIIKFNIFFFYIDHFVMRKGCNPGTGAFLKHDGSNLPWVIDDLKKKHPERFQEWLNHIQTALPTIEDIRAFRRPEDGFCFLMFKYSNTPELPSWTVSDGTLRLLALTLPAYLPDAQGIYMFEEPENGVHPQAIETVMDSMKSFYYGQVLITTHSPLILSLVKPEDVLCFWNDPERGTQVVTGDRHPYLKDWNGEISLGELFASGVFEWQPTQETIS